jgi:hypothetical protein
LSNCFILPLATRQQSIRGCPSLGDGLVDLRADLPRMPLLGDAPVHDRAAEGGGGEEPFTTERKAQDGSP